MNTILIADSTMEQVKILEFLIQRKKLGDVIETTDDGLKALDFIRANRPDLVILEYSLKTIDGNEVMRRAKKDGFTGKFIMISDKKDNELITKAYKEGASFFIRKPINLIEVIFVIENVLSHHNSEKFKIGVERLLNYSEDKNIILKDEDDRENNIRRILVGLGVNGYGGYQDLLDFILIANEFEKGNEKNYSLEEIYQTIGKRTSRNSKTVQQNIRRCIQRAMDNVALAGLEDYDSILFDRYSQSLFVFAELRKRMNYLNKGRGDKGKINIRKFAEGIFLLSND